MTNCQDICPYKKQCLQLFNHHGHETDSKYPHSECPMAWKIEDLLMDAEDIRREQEHMRLEEEQYYDE